MEADLKPGEGQTLSTTAAMRTCKSTSPAARAGATPRLPARKSGTFTGDIGFQNSPDAVTGSLGEGRFVLFFPGELHKPGVARPECTKVRKAVVKIRMEDKA